MTASLAEELIEQLVDGARYGDMEDVRGALDAGADVNGKDESSRTALHVAAANGHDEVVEALLGATADTEVANAEGNTPLHWACLNGHVEAVRLLIQAGANPSALNSQNRTPVDEALSRDFQEVMEVIRKCAKTTEGEDDDAEGPVPGDAGDTMDEETTEDVPES